VVLVDQIHTGSRRLPGHHNLGNPDMTWSEIEASQVCKNALK